MVGFDDLKDLFHCKQFNDVVAQYPSEEETHASREPKEDVSLLLEAVVVRTVVSCSSQDRVKVSISQEGHSQDPEVFGYGLTPCAGRTMVGGCVAHGDHSCVNCSPNLFA